ncbi:hypothetical protein BC827DRAFT_1366666 [Russula dissimulans]|nr:hypothetical protein BC827DRAFT_1366666 [Russula dissimulans]
MPRRSPSPGSFKRYRDPGDEDKYRTRHADADTRDGHRRGADRESRDDVDRRDRDRDQVRDQDRGGISERDARRGHHDDDRRRRADDEDDSAKRRKDGYDTYDDGRRRRDGDRDRDGDGERRRYASRPNEGAENSYRPRRQGDYRDRERGDRSNRPQDDVDRERERRQRDPDERRGDPSRRRSASPRRSRPQSRSRSLSAPAPASAPPEDKAKPNFAQSGLLAAATNTVKHADGTSTLLKYNEPPEARKPLVGWRLYVFKGDEQVDLLHIHRQSAYLVGRDRTVTDIPLEHPSCSKQHAVIQYRLVQDKNEFGDSKGSFFHTPLSMFVLTSSRPFVIDLESTNGTHVNGEAIPTSRYYELKASDVIKFGTSNREYVLLHDEVS